MKTRYLVALVGGLSIFSLVVMKWGGVDEYLTGSVIGTNMTTVNLAASGDLSVGGTLGVTGALTAAGNLSGKTLITPVQTTQSVANDGTISVTGSFVALQSSDTSLPMAAAVLDATTATIADGTAGQRLALSGSNNSMVVLYDQSDGVSTNLRLGASTRSITSGSVFGTVI